ncbi:MAG: DUF3078 domain-containing protein [Bacteroidetes bacterium]|nr:MAG: DUF3078 domain-containing protein [Bacteroidota bacterium]
MHFKSILIVGLLAVTSIHQLSAQVTEGEDKIRKKTIKDTTLGWKKGGVINLGMAQASLTNWAAGGESSIAFNGLVSLYGHRVAKKYAWENYLELGYGLLNQGNSDLWKKVDDRIDYTSKYGRKIKKSWYYAGLLNFKTQWTNGYNYPNDSVAISKFMAPGYLLVAVGAEYRPSSNFTLYIAPFTSKNTFVLDERLSNQGAFGVDSSKRVRSEFGGYLRMSWTKDLMENIRFQTKLELFSNYTHNPQNIDVSWETLLSMKVNKYISVTLGTHLLYDDDIDISVDENRDGVIDAVGPRVQFKQVLNVGFSYKF